MKSQYRKAIAWGMMAVIPIALLDVVRPRPAAANEFNDCIRQLTGTGITPREAGQACSDALIPKELSGCVAMIRNRTPIDAGNALRACYQVRRPIDLAYCVVDIHRGLPIVATNTKQEGAEKGTTNLSLLTLDSCRKSLLPGRYSECVTAVGRAVDPQDPAKALDTCLSAEDFPRDLFPSYPQNQQNQSPTPNL